MSGSFQCVKAPFANFKFAADEGGKVYDHLNFDAQHNVKQLPEALHPIGPVVGAVWGGVGGGLTAFVQMFGFFPAAGEYGWAGVTGDVQSCETFLKKGEPWDFKP